MRKSFWKKMALLLCGISLMGAGDAFGGGGGTRLINGRPVEAGTFQEVVAIKSDGPPCTAVVIGPKVIITAAHCIQAGGKAQFTVGGTTYEATMTQSPIYPGKDHDMALGVTAQEIKGITPAFVSGKATSGLGISLLGYGCTHPGGGGGSDGVLRIGETVVTGFSNYDMVSRKPGGAALCFGDTGGPAYILDSTTTKHQLLGVNCKGNVSDTNYDTRTDIRRARPSSKVLRKPAPWISAA